MNRWLALPISCLALGLVMVGCGGDEKDNGGGAQTAEQPAETGAATSGGVTVSMKDIEFVPMDVKVKSGGSVKWTNDDSIIHTVTKTSGPGEKFDSGNVAGGEAFEQKFGTPGKVDYVCTIHPQQIGTITVE